jgi:hypothetical protein
LNRGFDKLSLSGAVDLISKSMTSPLAPSLVERLPVRVAVGEPVWTAGAAVSD